MNANLNMNTYYNRPRSSADIRREYIQNSRRREAIAFVKSALNNPKVWYTVFAIKTVFALASAIALFTVIGGIESGELSFFSGIVAALVVAAVECVCFIPTGERPKSKK